MHRVARMVIGRYAGTMVVAAALLVGACSSGNDLAGDGGQGRGGGGGGANAGGAGGAAGASGGGGTAGGGTCTPSCGASDFCDLTPGTCTGGSGSCAPRPVDCIEPDKKVCGCDGNVYGSECEANARGLDVSDTGGCTPPAGMFPCGSIFCARGTEYCWQVLTTGNPIPGYFNCLPLPSACGTTPTCACVPNCPMCTASTTGDLTSTCLR